jgi:hypothetical protein
MSISTNAEAQAVHRLLRYLLPQLGGGAFCLPTADQVREDLALLASSAHAKLMCGPAPESVRFHWDHSAIASMRGRL